MDENYKEAGQNLLPPYNSLGFCDLKRRKSFSLAEVFITMTIVGVVAAIVIPAIYNYTQDLEFKSKFKKEFAALEQNTLLIARDNGGTVAGVLDTSGPNPSLIFSSYLNVINRSPNFGNYSGIFWPSNEQALAGVPCTGGNTGYFYMLADGAIISFNPANNSACLNSNYCAHIYIAVNGLSGPHVFGRDIFFVALSNTGNLMSPWYK